MFFNLFKKRISISYCITVCNEWKELEILLQTLLPLVEENDEVIVLQDITNRDNRVSNVLAKYSGMIILKETMLNNDFATFKNHFFELAKGDYLFQIDADEVPKDTLITGLKPILQRRRKYDCFLVPRINLVNGYTDEHVQKWNWNINEKGYINFPDYQPRIVKLNGKIKWKNKVHEVFTGYNKSFQLPAEDEYSLLHIKDIERQQRQNDFYDTLA
ncbi:glycosyltransferase [Mucilaginibacter limnophilus]|uniref:Glycosyltransferase n=1 Tax=Mucilaginibacter limnophilus TaxID=1932778 RepID=A0A3S2Y2B0_9SPHI|nr:glycosyltransferase [Mucilaginibacter limnophilus]RVU01804.1 glycosyltransferase [Mucilaginibacter limnophilus]